VNVFYNFSLFFFLYFITFDYTFFNLPESHHDFQQFSTIRLFFLPVFVISRRFHFATLHFAHSLLHNVYLLFFISFSFSFAFFLLLFRQIRVYY